MEGAYDAYGIVVYVYLHYLLSVCCIIVEKIESKV